MSLNNIKLQPQQVAGLFSDILVETELMAELITDQPVKVEALPAELPIAEPVAAPVAPAMIEETRPAVAKPAETVQEVQEVKGAPAIVPGNVVETAPAEVQFDFKGNNKKQVLVLFASDRALYLPDSELKFLLSVLKACMLTIEDVAILNIKTNPADYTKLHAYFNYKTVMLFGPGPQSIDLPMNFPQFQLQHFNKCMYLHAPALGDIEKAKELKMKLWTCLKNMFSL